MAAWAMRLSSQMCAGINARFFNCINEIIAMVAKEKMIWINTIRNITTMAN